MIRHWSEDANGYAENGEILIEFTFRGLVNRKIEGKLRVHTIEDSAGKFRKWNKLAPSSFTIQFMCFNFHDNSASNNVGVIRTN